nr:ABC transporter ATP-binding protein/permease [Halomicronema hongdechloris]
MGGSLGNNILLGLQASPTALETAIHQAVFEHDLAAMPQGLTTPIGPRGVRLSGGQLQRAAAAHMFVRQPELLVFDDLSSALDVETDPPSHHPTTPSLSSSFPIVPLSWRGAIASLCSTTAGSKWKAPSMNGNNSRNNKSWGRKTMYV